MTRYEFRHLKKRLKKRLNEARFLYKLQLKKIKKMRREERKDE